MQLWRNLQHSQPDSSQPASEEVGAVQRRRAVFAKDLSAHPIHALADALGVPAAVAVPYLQARQDWRSRQVIAQRQVASWRSAALASVVIMAAIGWTLALPLATSPALPHLLKTSSENAGSVALQKLPAPKTTLLIPTHRRE
jgi:hypothetical protein